MIEQLSPEEILTRLAELSREIEAHKAAASMVRAERNRLRWKLRRSDWRPPEVAHGEV